MSTFRLSADYLPDSIFNSLSLKAHLVWRQYQRIFNIRKEVITLEHAHVTPSLAYLAGKTGLSRYQVSRANTELVTAGLLRRSQARTPTGIWKNLVVKLGDHFTALWKTFQEKKKGNINVGLHNSANIENKEPLEDNYYTEFCKFMKNIGSGGARPAPA